MKALSRLILKLATRFNPQFVQGAQTWCACRGQLLWHQNCGLSVVIETLKLHIYVYIYIYIYISIVRPSRRGGPILCPSVRPVVVVRPVVSCPPRRRYRLSSVNPSHHRSRRRHYVGWRSFGGTHHEPMLDTPLQNIELVRLCGPQHNK